MYFCSMHVTYIYYACMWSCCWKAIPTIFLYPWNTFFIWVEWKCLIPRLSTIYFLCGGRNDETRVFFSSFLFLDRPDTIAPCTQWSFGRKESRVRCKLYSVKDTFFCTIRKGKGTLRLDEYAVAMTRLHSFWGVPDDASVSSYFLFFFFLLHVLCVW